MTLSQLSAGLLFLHGHITDPALASALATAQDRPATPTPRSSAMDLFKSLMYLGGRPMHPGHNFDLDEPFEPDFGNRAANARLFGPTPLRQDAPTGRQDARARAAAPCASGCA